MSHKPSSSSQELQLLQRHHALAASHLTRSVTAGKAWQETKKQETDLSRQIEASQLQIEALQLQKDALNGKVKGFVRTRCDENKRAMKHLVAIGASECLVLCETLYNTLPRELRDMVYSYTVTDEAGESESKIVTYGSCCDITTPWYSSFCSKPHLCQRGICKAHFMCVEYTGADVHAEIVESWLKGTAFFFDDDEWTSLPKLLQSDRWIIGRDAYKFVSCINITVSDDVQPRHYKHLEVLALLKPSAIVIFYFDLSDTHCSGKRDLRAKFVRQLQDLWGYLKDLGRLEIAVWHGNYLSLELENGATTVDEWTQKLEQTSRKCYECRDAYGQNIGLIERGMRNYTDKPCPKRQTYPPPAPGKEQM